MRLQEIQTWAVAPPDAIGGRFWIIVKIKSDSGIEGIGECYGIPFSSDIACKMVEDTFARFVAGGDPHDIETLFRRVYSAGFTQRPDLSLMGVFSGIEIAIWDILGKMADLPVYRLLGGKFHERLRTYTYLYPEDPGDPKAPDVYHDGDIAAERALHYLDLGFGAIKQDPAGPYSFQGGRELSRKELARCEYCMRRIREAVGDRADILFGTHGQMTSSSAIRLAKRIEPYDPLWFEEPCPPDQMEAIGKVAHATPIPVATGERLTTRIEFHQALKAGVSILQPNVGRSGGIWETKKIAQMAELFNAQIAPHIYCGPIAHAAAAHLSFASPNFLILETIQSPFHDAILKKRLRWEDGYILAPEEPGLGIELDEETALANLAPAGSGLHLEMCQTPLPSDNEKIITEL
ncbi:MAG: mandelate racemase/muconate lactonizing enzyme family protein [Ectothiorhodospiraceae bacterium AqS1]|nr:mandelate racemase/muconate lactonizing enzyme family protein [Ectothiorhodospiraceae bacterium AqS1]